VGQGKKENWQVKQAECGVGEKKMVGEPVDFVLMLTMILDSGIMI